MVVLWQLVAFGRREAQMTMVPVRSKASAAPDRPPTHKTPAVQPGKLQTMENEHGRVFCKVVTGSFEQA